MRSSSSRFVVGPKLYRETEDDNSSSSRRNNRNHKFTAASPTPDLGSLTFRSDSVTRIPSVRPKRKTSDKEHIIELSNYAKESYEELMARRALNERRVREISDSIRMDGAAQKKTMDMIGSTIDGIEWRNGCDQRAMKKDMNDCKKKVDLMEELARRVVDAEDRINKLEAGETTRDLQVATIEKNWNDYSRLRNQALALDITSLRTRHGLDVTSRVPVDVAKRAAKNFHRMSINLARLVPLLVPSTDQAQLADEALTLTGALATLFGHDNSGDASSSSQSRESGTTSSISATSIGSTGSSMVSTNEVGHRAQDPIDSLKIPDSSKQSSLRKVSSEDKEQSSDPAAPNNGAEKKPE